MHSLYNFLVGPMAWIAFIVFFGGLIVRLFSMISRARSKDPWVYEHFSLYFGLRSIIAWSIPFVPVNARRHPVMAGVTYAFHYCLFLAPLFLMAHVMMLDEGIGLSWWSMPDTVADTLTVVVILGCVFFAARRMTQPEVKYVTSGADYALIGLVAAPFVTGFLAYHQIGDYMTMVVLHIIAGEAMLILIPFTWLAHMMLAPMIRAYQGSEFGGVRNIKDW